MTPQQLDLLASFSDPDHAGKARMDAARAAAEPRIAAVEAHADPDWLVTALELIRNMAPGHMFLAQEVTAEMAELGHTTHDKRAAGAVIRKAKTTGLIEPAGFGIDAFASPKTLWRRAK